MISLFFITGTTSAAKPLQNITVTAGTLTFAPGYTYYIDADDTISVASGATLNFVGTSVRNMVTLRSDAATQWDLNNAAGSTVNANYLDVQYSNASQSVTATNSTNSGNNSVTWNFGTTGIRYWVASSITNWNSTSSWSTTSGGTAGASVPASGNPVVFDAGGLGSCTINATVDVASLNIMSGYTGTISQGANAVTIGTAGFNQAAGTFTGGSAAITNNGDFTLSAGAFTSTSNTLSVAGDWNDLGGTFTHNSGTINFTKATGTQTINTSGTKTFKNITHSGAGTLQVSGWPYMKEITINKSMVIDTDSSDGETNFPVLIYRGADADLAAHAQASGNDIYITSSNGITRLSHEIEKYDSSTGELWLWVKVPVLLKSADTVLHMYYGNASCSSQQNKTDVWSNGYAGVWHMGDGATLNSADSSSFSNNGTATGVTASLGKISGSATFDGAAGHYISVPESASIDFGGEERSFTLSAWLKKTNNSRRDMYVSQRTGYTYMLQHGYDSDNKIYGWGVVSSSAYSTDAQQAFRLQQLQELHM